MTIQNIVKKSLLIFLSFLLFTWCSSAKIPSQTPSQTPTQATGFMAKAQEVQQNVQGVQSGVKTAQESYASAEKLVKQFQSKGKSNAGEAGQSSEEGGEKSSFDLFNPPPSSNAPTNVPAQELVNLPKYGSWFDRAFGRVIEIRSDVQRGANQNFPIVFDLVFVKNPDIYPALTNTTTRDWFRVNDTKINELKKDNKLLEIESITVIPERNTYSYLIRVPSHIIVGLLFVRLVGNNNRYPSVFDPYQNMTLQFNSNNFDYKQFK